VIDSLRLIEEEGGRCAALCVNKRIPTMFALAAGKLMRVGCVDIQQLLHKGAGKDFLDGAVVPFE
jgi:hypothetical protein